jgi:hypothetical protein
MNEALPILLVQSRERRLITLANTFDERRLVRHGVPSDKGSRVYRMIGLIIL